MCPWYYSRILRPDLPFAKFIRLLQRLCGGQIRCKLHARYNEARRAFSPLLWLCSADMVLPFQESDPSDVTALSLFLDEGSGLMLSPTSQLLVSVLNHQIFHLKLEICKSALKASF